MAGLGGLGIGSADSRVLTIRKLLIISTLIVYGVAMAAHVLSVPTVAIEVEAAETQVAQQATTTEPRMMSSKKPIDATTIEHRVRAYFEDLPVMVEIARCESHFSQLDPITGEVMRGRVDPADTGVMQINTRYHAKTAEKLGLDLNDLSGNLHYARYLYETQGTAPWNASRACWQPSLLAQAR